MNKIKALFEHPRYGEILRFLFGGFLTTVVNYVIYIPFYYFLFEQPMGEELGSIAANAVAWAGSVIFAFFINKHLVYRSHTSKQTGIWQFVVFVATRAISGIVEIFLPAAFIYFGINNLVAKTLVAMLLLVCNYLTGKFLAFRRHADLAEISKKK